MSTDTDTIRSAVVDAVAAPQDLLAPIVEGFLTAERSRG
jgi:hypothetical protein